MTNVVLDVVFCEAKPNVKTDYLECVLRPNNLRQVLALATKKLAQVSDRFDAIAFRGMSGALVAPVVAANLDKALIMVRKAQEHAHSPYMVEGCCESLRYIILDDFVSSGGTVQAIVSDIYHNHNTEARCVGLAMYELARFNPPMEMCKIRDWFYVACEPVSRLANRLMQHINNVGRIYDSFAAFKQHYDEVVDFFFLGEDREEFEWSEHKQSIDNKLQELEGWYALRHPQLKNLACVAWSLT